MAITANATLNHVLSAHPRQLSNLIVGQSGGPTAVINSSLAGVVETAKASGHVNRILGMRRGVEGLLRGETVDLTDLSREELHSLAMTPGAALGSCRHKLDDPQADAVLKKLVEFDVEFLCYIGGNDSADTVRRLNCRAQLANLDLKAIAVPKTIDNDLPETDH